jgi:hypothetical protein
MKDAEGFTMGKPLLYESASSFSSVFIKESILLLFLPSLKTQTWKKVHVLQWNDVC